MKLFFCYLLIKLYTQEEDYSIIHTFMPNNVLLYFILWIVIFIFLAILISMIGKFLKGNITIDLFKKTYNYGGEISGTFTLEAKHAIAWQDLSIHLIGFQKVTVISQGQRRSRKEEFTRFSQHIESGVHYEQWLKRDYDIKIQIPTEAEIFGDKMPYLWEWKLAIIARLAWLNRKTSKYTWMLRVDLDAKWFDLSSQKNIFITKTV